MPTVDLVPSSTPSTPSSSSGGSAADPAAGTLEGLPRRLALTLAELRVLASLAGDAPLPFDVTPVADEASAGSFLDDRLGRSRVSGDEQAYADAVSGLHEPSDALTKRGLLVDGVADRGVLGALGLLASATLAVDLDVVVGSVRARAWHRQSGSAVAALATTDGIVFELAYFETAQWPGELARVAALPEDVEPEASAVPDLVDLPWELVDGCGEAIRTQRTDLVPVIVAAHAGRVRGGDGEPVPDATVGGLLGALAGETQGRLRALVADVGREDVPVVGVVSWVLLADGWRSLRAYQAGSETATETGTETGSDTGSATGTERRLEVRRVDPADLGALLAPVLVGVSA